ncbi:hypothetical protein BH11BAC7_BH11BAC7_16470 [soil metagenome]
MRFFSTTKSICRLVISIAAVFIFQTGKAQVVVSGANSGNGNYPTLSSACSSINFANQAGANIIMTITASTNENIFTSTLQGGLWISLRIRPAVGVAATISGVTTGGNPLIDLNGADNVTIDGLNTGGSSLTISNSSTSSTNFTSTIRLSNGATNNTVTNCTIEGSATGTTTSLTATIFFYGDAVTPNGSDNNTFSNNNIKPAGVNLPAKAIASFGSFSPVAIANSGMTITGNNIFDYFGDNGSAGILLDVGTTDWTITNNKFYQTSVRTQTIAGTHAAIQFNNSGINNCLVSGNIIGYANASGTGLYTISGIQGTRFYPIYVASHGTTAGTVIQNNTITAISFSGNCAGVGALSPFIGIDVAVGRVTVTNNLIGSATVPGAIVVASTSVLNGETYGVLLVSVLSTTCSNNSIGGITVSNAGGGGITLTGIRFNSSGGLLNTAQNNTIGFETAPLISNSVLPARVTGLYSQGGASNFTGNTIAYLSSNSANTGTGMSSTVTGIFSDNSSATLLTTISGNTIHSLSNTHASAAVTVAGISYYGNAALSGNSITQNFIHSLSNASSSTAAAINGIYVQAGQTTISNNMIRLGIDAAGASITTATSVTGIWENAGTNQFYFNSVYIGGTGVTAGVNSFAFLSAATTTTRSYENNIFYNGRSNGTATAKNYAIAVGGTGVNPAGLLSDYNDIFASGAGGITGLYNSTDYSTIATWTAATGQDGNSQNSNPQFINATGTNATVNLHIAAAIPTWIEGTGTPIGSVLIDYDGQTRSSFSPTDIGADAGNFFSFLPPTLGVYPATSIIAGTNATITPGTAPTNTNSAIAYTNTNFTGIFHVNPLTGVVTVTDAKQAGTYPVTVKAFSGTGSVTSTFTLTVTNPNCSQGIVTGTNNISVGAGPQGVAVGDFNNDGNQDVATANNGNSTISIRLGNGAGGFSGTTDLTGVGSGPRYLAVGDFNGDGNQDLVNSAVSSAAIFISLGDGLGGFSAATSVAVASFPTGVTVGDFNNDGKQDVVVGTSGSTVSIRLGDGSGGFTAMPNIVTASPNWTVGVGDFNEDGKQDLAIVSNSAIFIRLGDGVGNFSGTTTISAGPGCENIAIADFNHDNHQDFAVSNGSSGTVSVRLGDGLGGFSGTIEITAGSSTSCVAVGDFNGDGNPDLAIARITSVLLIRYGDGLGNFSGSFSITAGGNTTRKVVVGDFNNDGFNDLAAPSESAGTVAIRLGGGNEINVTGNAVTIADGDVTPSAADFTNFGTACSGSIVKTFIIQNTGTQSLTTAGVTVSGAAAGDFSVTSLPATTIAASGSTSFQVTFTASAAGVRNATLTIANNDCDEGSYDFAISGTGSTPITGSTVITNLACFGGSNGAINLTPSGGTPGYTFNWLPSGPTTEDRTSLTAGTYSVQITDLNGCTGTVTTTVTQPPAISVTASAQTNVACFGGSNGAVSINAATGGAGGFTYDWTPGNPAGDGTTSVTGLTAGAWTVTTTDANGCTATNAFTVTQPPAISVTASAQTNVACFGGNTGAASINAATGGAGGFTYNWTPGNPTGDGTTSVTGLTAGIWTVTTTDANGCTATNAFTLTQPPAISVTASAQTNVACFGGNTGAASINAATGGAGGFTYNWTPGNPAGDGTTSVTGLTAGTWTVTTTDANGCTATNAFTLTQPPAISVTASAQTNVACFGGNTGAASINAATGGAGGFTYNWTPGNPAGDGTTSVTGLTAGIWTVTTTDANGCTATNAFTVTQPPAISVTASAQTNVACFGGSNGAASINAATGGAGGFTYNWTPGNPAGDGTTSVTGLTAGTWTVTTTDANGCTATNAFTVTQPPAISVTASAQTNVACFGGSNGAASINAANGGAGGFTYNWTPGNPAGDGTTSVTGLTAGTWTVTTTDANGCTVTNAFTVTEPSTAIASTSSATSILCNGGNTTVTVAASGGTSPYTGEGTFTEVVGTYSYTVTDANGCLTTTSVTITEPTVLTSASSASAILCNGGNATVTVTASGGTSPYTGEGTFTETAGNYSYTVTDANGCLTTTSVTITEPTVLTSASSASTILCNGGNATVTVTASDGTSPYTGEGTFTEVAGNYSYTVTDANGCTSSTSVTITEPTVLSSASSASAILCNGGSSTVTVTASGGTSPYTGEGTFTEIAGTYAYTVTDNNGCTSSTSVTITEPTVLSSASSATSILCNGGNATVTVTASGGTSPYSGEGTFTEVAGTYSYTVTDNNGCTSTTSVTVTEPDVLSVFVNAALNPTTCSGTDGSIDIDVIGGTTSYSFLWSNNDTNEDLTNIVAGAYSVTVTDANGCIATTNASINDPGAPTVTLALQMDTICGNFPGTIILSGESPAGGTFSGTGVSGNTFDPFAAGFGTHFITYTFTDVSGCTGTTTDSIFVDDCMGIETPATSQWSIFPNPTNAELTINTSSEINTDVIVDVYSADGKLIRSENKQQAKTITLDMTDQPVGVYFIRITANEKVSMYRVVKI